MDAMADHALTCNRGRGTAACPAAGSWKTVRHDAVRHRLFCLGQDAGHKAGESIGMERIEAISRQRPGDIWARTDAEGRPFRRHTREGPGSTPFDGDIVVEDDGGRHRPDGSAQHRARERRITETSYDVGITATHKSTINNGQPERGTTNAAVYPPAPAPKPRKCTTTSARSTRSSCSG